jgi:hypothetical protein
MLRIQPEQGEQTAFLFAHFWLLLRRGAGRPYCGTRGHQDTAAFFGYFHPNLQNRTKGIEGFLRQLIRVEIVNGFGKNLQ